MHKCLYINGSSLLQINLFKVTIDFIHDMIANAGAEKCQTKKYHKTIENIALNKKLKKFNVVILIGQNDVYLDYYEQHYVYFNELFSIVFCLLW